jgi:UDP-N-acetylglucosamine 2-epimerase (non-hydrolysing)
MLLDLIVGTRPNFIKVAALINEITKYNFYTNKKIKFRLIHTGQHYSRKLSNNFFDDLQIPKPDFNINAGSGSQAKQKAHIMIGYEKILFKKKPDICIVVGDVNSTVSCAIVAKKMNVGLAHIEAGIRSNDRTMPEEINRILTDSITDYFFTTSMQANKNLIQEGVEAKKIYFVGNTMIDTLKNNLNKLKCPKIWDQFNLEKNKYILLTLHRPSNVDDHRYFKNILTEIKYACANDKIIFPIHPRSKKQIKLIKHLPKNIHLVSPQSYLEFIYLLKNCKAILTDSGGVSEEATILNIPCLTFRNSTERPETILEGTNHLIGSNLNNLNANIKKINKGLWKKGRMPNKWDGKTSKRILLDLIKIINKNEKYI